jgi:outer membrane biosynthesis protein TonB
MPKLSLNIPKELEKDMDYQRYYRLVRDRIRSYAERNYRGFESSGIVHMAFVVGEKGVLRNIRIFKQDTSANDLLLQVAARSVKDSAPFPAFPSELSHKELPFSIYIEFKRD